MSLIPSSKEELDKKLEDLRDWISLKIQGMMIAHGDDLLIHECPKCRTRYPLQKIKSFGVDSVTNWVYQIAKDQEIARIILLKQMAESTLEKEGV